MADDLPLSRRNLLRVVAMGAGGVAGAATQGGDGDGSIIPVIGGGGGEVQAVARADNIEIAVATTLGAVPEPSVKPQLIYVTGSNAEKGVYVNYDASLPFRVRLSTFEIAVASSLGGVPEADTRPQFIFITGTGSERGEYVDLDGVPVEVSEETFEMAAADALGDISAADVTPAVNQVRASGSTKGTHVNA